MLLTSFLNILKSVHSDWN